MIVFLVEAITSMFIFLGLVKKPEQPKFSDYRRLNQ